MVAGSLAKPQVESENVSCSVMSGSVTPCTVAHQAPLSMEFSRQEYCNGLPFPSPGDCPNPGIEPRSPALQADSLPTEPPGYSSEQSPTEWATVKIQLMLCMWQTLCKQWLSSFSRLYSTSQVVFSSVDSTACCFCDEHDRLFSIFPGL